MSLATIPIKTTSKEFIKRSIVFEIVAGLETHQPHVLDHACAALSVLVAGLSEVHRKGYPLTEQALSGKVLQVSAMACFQLAPHLPLFSVPGSVISFHLTPSHIRGNSLHFLPLSYRGSCFLGALIIQLVYLLSGGNLYPNTLHEGNLEHFFFFLAMLMTINTLVFWWISSRYLDLSVVQCRGVGSSLLAEKLLQYKTCL
ncbi:unnamed protein product [Coregonus sp. 'balchen']|nr:unnamed protein product [Coregonus sp. 'balchen']